MIEEAKPDGIFCLRSLAGREILKEGKGPDWLEPYLEGVLGRVDRQAAHLRQQGAGWECGESASWILCPDAKALSWAMTRYGIRPRPSSWEGPTEEEGGLRWGCACLSNSMSIEFAVPAAASVDWLIPPPTAPGGGLSAYP